MFGEEKKKKKKAPSLRCTRGEPTHHSQVLQHLSVHSGLVELVFVLRESDVIEPACERQKSPIGQSQKDSFDPTLCF